MKKTITAIVTLLCLTIQIEAMKFSNPETSVDPKKINSILKVIDLRIEHQKEIRNCISKARSENDIAKCRVLKARAKNSIEQKIMEIKSDTPGISLF